MGKLIELEWRKNRIGNWVRWAALLGAALGLLIFAMAFLGIANDPETGVPDAAPGHGGISSLIELLTSMCFLVFTGVMLSVFIVGAYQNGTMSLVFSYPVRRQKLLAAQMLAVWIFCFGALAAAKLLLYGCVLAGSRFLPSAFPLDFDMTRGAFYGQLLLRSAVTVTEGFTLVRGAGPALGQSCHCDLLPAGFADPGQHWELYHGGQRGISRGADRHLAPGAPCSACGGRRRGT